MHLERGEHVVLVGPNGSGKTTLIETIAGRRPPAAGSVAARAQGPARLPLPARRDGRRRGHRARGGAAPDRAQHAEGTRPARRLPLLGPRDGEGAGRDLRRRAAPALAGDPGRLGRQPAAPRRAHQPPRPGEPRGAGGRPHLVRGDLLLVSHDRALLEAVGVRTLACEEGELRSYPGRVGRVRARPRGARGGAPRGGGACRGRAPGRRQRRAGPSKNALRRVAELERRIEEAEAELRALEDELADPAMWSSPGRAERATAAPPRGEGGDRATLRASGRRRRRPPSPTDP